MVDMVWQVQEAKQRFSEVLRAAETQGVQRVTRHGKDVAVVMSIDEYHRISRVQPEPDLLAHLLAFPKLDLPAEEYDELFARERQPDTRPIPFVDY